AQDLGRGGLPVVGRVGRVGELRGQEPAMLLCQLARLLHHPGAALGGRGQDHLGAVGAHQLAALDREGLHHHRHEPVAARGYRFVAVMVETFSIERRKLMRAYGAKVILTPAAERGTGMVKKARELAEKHGWFLASQFANPANPAYHRQTTAAEILRDFAGRRLDYFVSGWGTGGTLTGVGEVLKVARPEVKIIATEPTAASLLGGKEWAPHKIQGWTPDFLPEVLNRDVHDELVPVTDDEA